MTIFSFVHSYTNAALCVRCECPGGEEEVNVLNRALVNVYQFANRPEKGVVAVPKQETKLAAKKHEIPFRLLYTHSIVSSKRVFGHCPTLSQGNITLSFKICRAQIDSMHEARVAILLSLSN
jgi:hypothetical protein